MSDRNVLASPSSGLGLRSSDSSSQGGNLDSDDSSSVSTLPDGVPQRVLFNRSVSAIFPDTSDKPTALGMVTAPLPDMTGKDKDDEDSEPRKKRKKTVSMGSMMQTFLEQRQEEKGGLHVAMRGISAAMTAMTEANLGRRAEQQESSLWQRYDKVSATIDKVAEKLAVATTPRKAELEAELKDLKVFKSGIWKQINPAVGDA